MNIYERCYGYEPAQSQVNELREAVVRALALARHCNRDLKQRTGGFQSLDTEEAYFQALFEKYKTAATQQ